MATKTPVKKTSTVKLEDLFEEPKTPAVIERSTATDSTAAGEAASLVAKPERLQPEALVGELMSVKAAAEMLGLSLSSISHHVKQGHIKALAVGTSSILLRWSVEEFAASRAVTKEDDEEAKALRARLKALKAKKNGK